MNKLLILFFLMMTRVMCLAQADTTLLLSKRGRPILPQAGDYAIGVDATPFFRYLGNMFNNTDNNAAPTFTSPAFPSLIGKYMISANTAIRVKFAANSLSQDGKNTVDDSYSADPTSLVTDTKNYTSTYILLGAGLEKRRGTGRLQGVYGAEAFVGISSNSSTYTYGNPITPATPSVASTIWNTNGVSAINTSVVSSRILESSSGTSVSFGVKGFVGVEYFFAPKMSLGGELGYSVSYTGLGSGTQRTESFNAATNSVIVTNSGYYPIPGAFSMGAVAQGSLFLSLYF